MAGYALAGDHPTPARRSRPAKIATAYSSWGYSLLGALVEDKAGRPFPDYVREEVAPGLAIRADATDSGDPPPQV